MSNNIKNKADMKREYKDNPPPAGIFKITNKINGKILIGKGLNVQGILNSQEFQLKCGSHKNKDLQADWNKIGAVNFNFEIIDYLKPAENSKNDLIDDLAELEVLWLAKLNPYNEKGYNKLK